MQKSRQRILAFDIIRIVAILLVLLVHVSAYMVIQYPQPSTNEFIVGNIFNGISRAGVPLFIMLSGALLLNEERKFDTKKFYKKSLLAMLLLLIGWLLFYGVFYAVILPLLKGETITASAFFDYLLTFKGSDYPHLWYMFMIVGLYLIIPVLNLFVKKENIKYVVGITIICIIVQFLGQTLNVFTINSEMSVSSFIGKFHLEYATGYAGYLLLGWLFSNYQLKKSYRIAIYSVGIAALIVSILAVQFCISDIENIRDFVYEPLSFTALLYGCSVFVFISSVCKEKQTNKTSIRLCSDFSFGIYIIHILFLEILVQVLLPYSAFNPSSPLLYIGLIYIIASVCSFVIVCIFSKIKYLKKLFYIK